MKARLQTGRPGGGSEEEPVSAVEQPPEPHLQGQSRCGFSQEAGQMLVRERPYQQL
jgi:hypothetical protein